MNRIPGYPSWGPKTSCGCGGSCGVSCGCGPGGLTSSGSARSPAGLGHTRGIGESSGLGSMQVCAKCPVTVRITGRAKSLVSVKASGPAGDCKIVPKSFLGISWTACEKDVTKPCRSTNILITNITRNRIYVFQYVPNPPLIPGVTLPVRGVPGGFTVKPLPAPNTAPIFATGIAGATPSPGGGVGVPGIGPGRGFLGSGRSVSLPGGSAECGEEIIKYAILDFSRKKAGDVIVECDTCPDD